MQGTPEMCEINHVVVGGQQYRQIQIPSYMLKTLHTQDIYTRTFINCGADINCINYNNFARRNRIPLKKLKKPLLVNNIGGSPNEVGTIKHPVTLFIRMGGIIHKVFYTIKCGKDNLILGLPWLNQINPSINWGNKHVDIHEATDQSEEYNLTMSQGRFMIRKATTETPMHPELLPPNLEKEPPIFLDENFIDYIRGAKHVYVNWVNQFEKINGKLVPLAITKTSIASELA